MSDSLREKIELQYQLNYEFSKQYGLAYFLDATVIASANPQRFGAIADPWQRELLAPKIPAVNAIAGLNPGYTGRRSFLTILPRGHDKSSAEGRIANFLVTFSRNPINGYLVAADKDQGRIIVDSARAEANLNPWYGNEIKFSKYAIEGPAGTMEVVPADASSAFGFQGNIYVLDEVTHWKQKTGQDVYNAIVTGREKFPGSLLIGIMNAWVKGSWQEKLLIHPAMADPEEWVVFYREGSLASWMTPERIAKVRRLVPAPVARRMFDNIPIDPVVESGYLDPLDISRCVSTKHTPHYHYQAGNQYVFAFDYGVTKDRAVGVVGHLEEGGVLSVDEMAVWTPKDFADGRILVRTVDNWLDDRIKKFKPVAVVLDPWQLEGTIQRLNARGVPVEPFNARGGLGNMDLAMTLRNLIGSHRVRWAPSQGRIEGADDDTLEKELAALVTVVKAYGWRLDHSAGMHDDRAVALGMMATGAVRFPYVAPTTKSKGGETMSPPPQEFFTSQATGRNPLVA